MVSVDYPTVHCMAANETMTIRVFLKLLSQRIFYRTHFLIKDYVTIEAFRAMRILGGYFLVGSPFWYLATRNCYHSYLQHRWNMLL